MSERLAEVPESRSIYPEEFRTRFLISAKLVIEARKKVDKATLNYLEAEGNSSYRYDDKVQMSEARYSAIDEHAAYIAVNSFDLVNATHDYQKNGEAYVEQAIEEAETSGLVINLKKNPKE